MKGLVLRPMDEEWFPIIPAEIDMSLFAKPRKNAMQERTRFLIVEAMGIIIKNPKLYKQTFKTFRPAKIWSKATEFNLIEQARWNGNYLGTWIDQSIEWAQRIQNGETWEALCNGKDNLRWYRMIMWKDGEARLIGGSTKNNDCSSPTTITGSDDKNLNEKLAHYTIPLVVKY